MITTQKGKVVEVSKQTVTREGVSSIHPPSVHFTPYRSHLTYRRQEDKERETLRNRFKNR